MRVAEYAFRGITVSGRPVAAVRWNPWTLLAGSGCLALAVETAPGGGQEGGGVQQGSRKNVTALAMGALGVVFGDIGTSPLYALETVFTADNHAVHATPGEVYGVISLIFWSITLIVSVKYVGFIMQADNRGEGGIIALTALLERTRVKSVRAKSVLIALGILGASLFYGDAMITPAISVLSATEGLKVAAPGLSGWVVPIAVAVLTALFALQRYGSSLIGKLFGPVMAIWFTVLALLGIVEILRHPEVLGALSPWYAWRFMGEHGLVAFVALGSVVLAVTGAEALYADMGHFGRPPIRLAWFLLVFPALTLNYLGQGSLILRSPAAIENPFYLLVPNWAQLPMVILATAATIIASQAVISGTFSVTRQAVRLGYLPHLTVRHTSADEEGQVYVPAVNLALFISVTVLLIIFRSSAELATAYGVAVTGTFLLNTSLFLAVARVRWHTRRLWIALGAAVFLSVELAFFFATLTKVVQRGWLPLGVGLSIFAVMMTWRRGMQIISDQQRVRLGEIGDFVRNLTARTPPVQRVSGTAVFLNSSPHTVPPALYANVEHNHVVHQQVVTLAVKTERVPHVPPDERLTSRHIGDPDYDVTQLTARFGYLDHPNVPAAIDLAVGQGHLRELDRDRISYFLSWDRIMPAQVPSMNRWRRKVFLAMARNGVTQAGHFRLPPRRTVALGGEFEI
jgi:KUP system potassium uptake protein